MQWGAKYEKLEKGIILAASLAMAAGIMAGCGGEKKAASSEGLKPLKVATNATYVPFEFKSKDGKDYTGYEIDVSVLLLRT